MGLTGNTGEVNGAIVNVGEAASSTSSSRRSIEVSLVSQSLATLDTSSQQPITSESGAKSLVQALSSAIHDAAVGGTLTADELTLSMVILERAVSSTRID